MNDKLQNKISKAISSGINLGIELYDGNELDNLDINLQNEIQSNHRFKKLDPFININQDVEKLLNGDYSSKWKFEILCKQYIDDFYSIYTVFDIKLLRKLLIILTHLFGASINLNWINVSNLNNSTYYDTNNEVFVGLFAGLKFNGDISQWDVSNMTSMEYMFENSDFNGDISHWDVSNVCNMEAMFAFSEFNGDLSKWDVSNVTNMESMFESTKFNGDLSTWDVSNVKNMESMFEESLFNGDISNWNTRRLKTTYKMFAESKFNRDISHWNISCLSNMIYMFFHSEFNHDLSDWDVSHVQKKMDAFTDCNIKEEYLPQGL